MADSDFLARLREKAILRVETAQAIAGRVANGDLAEGLYLLSVAGRTLLMWCGSGRLGPVRGKDIT